MCIRDRFEIVLALLLAIGSFFILVGAFSLLKLSSFFKRLHGPTKASTLGVGCVLLASVGYPVSYTHLLRFLRGRCVIIYSYVKM